MEVSRAGRPQIVLAARCIIANDENELLFVKRDGADSFNSGLWEFPGGKMDVGQDVSEALRRETYEETGLEVDPELPLYCTESYVMEGGKYEGLVYVGLYGLARVNGSHIKLSEEHEASSWKKIDEAQQLSLTSETRNTLQILGSTVLQPFLHD